METKLRLSEIGFSVLEELYSNVDGMDISRKGRDVLKNESSSLTYGELIFKEFASLLASTQPQPGEIFYDLGSGTGKAVLCAAFLYDWKGCYGIELLKPLYQSSIEIFEKFKQHPIIQQNFPSVSEKIHFIQTDLIHTDISQADVVYAHATCFAPELWDPLLEQFKRLKAGARIIVVTKSLDEGLFEKIQESSTPFTWGTGTVSIYRKKS